jgi:hypothetical protein
VVENNREPANQQQSEDKMKELGEDIIKLLNERTENPSEAFVLLQQLSIYLWDAYKIDWHDKGAYKVAPTRRQRYLEFVAGLVDNMTEPEKPEAAQ